MVICVCCKIYFLIDHHCKTSQMGRNYWSSCRVGLQSQYSFSQIRQCGQGCQCWHQYTNKKVNSAEFDLAISGFWIQYSITKPFSYVLGSSNKLWLMHKLTLGVIGGPNSRLNGWFRVLASKFWKGVGTYECYFVILWMQVEWWGNSEVVRTLKPYLL